VNFRHLATQCFGRFWKFGVFFSVNSKKKNANVFGKIANLSKPQNSYFSIYIFLFYFILFYFLNGLDGMMIRGYLFI